MVDNLKMFGLHVPNKGKFKDLFLHGILEENVHFISM